MSKNAKQGLPNGAVNPNVGASQNVKAVQASAKMGIDILVSKETRAINSSILKKICEDFTKCISKHVRSEICETVEFGIHDIGSSFQAIDYKKDDEEKVFFLVGSKIAGNSLLVFDNAVIKGMASILMGAGDGSIGEQVKSVTKIEKKIFSAFVDTVISCLIYSFSSIKDMEFFSAGFSDFKALELSDNDMAYKFSISLSVSNVRGNIEFIMPYSTI